MAYLLSRKELKDFLCLYMCTWGHLHKVQCELEDCRQYHLMAQRSGLTFSQCEHMRSVEHCREIATEEWLKEETLEQMVKLKFFGEAKKATCTKRQTNAQKAHVPLCVEVAFQNDPTQFCLSIHEPALHHYSRLGRVMVTYNSIAHTWHCPCAKPRISCVHKNIGKWHLFQKTPEIFSTETTASTPQQQQPSLYPPSAEILEQLVQYIYKHKQLPATLPDDIIKPKPPASYITELHPSETTCTICPGSVDLEKSTLISRNARIITMNGVTERKLFKSDCNILNYSKSCNITFSQNLRVRKCVLFIFFSLNRCFHLFPSMPTVPHDLPLPGMDG